MERLNCNAAFLFTRNSRIYWGDVARPRAAKQQVIANTRIPRTSTDRYSCAPVLDDSLLFNSSNSRFASFHLSSFSKYTSQMHGQHEPPPQQSSLNGFSGSSGSDFIKIQSAFFIQYAYALRVFFMFNVNPKRSKLKLQNMILLAKTPENKKPC